MPKPTVQLTSCDGNAFAILGRCLAAARKAGWTAEQRADFADLAKSGDYDNLLKTVHLHFEVT